MQRSCLLFVSRRMRTAIKRAIVWSDCAVLIKTTQHARDGSNAVASLYSLFTGAAFRHRASTLKTNVVSSPEQCRGVFGPLPSVEPERCWVAEWKGLRSLRHPSDSKDNRCTCSLSRGDYHVHAVINPFSGSSSGIQQLPAPAVFLTFLWHQTYSHHL